MRHFLSSATLAATLAATAFLGQGATSAQAGDHHDDYGYGPGYGYGRGGGPYRGGYGCSCGVRNCRHGGGYGYDHGYRPRPYIPPRYPRPGYGYGGYRPIVPVVPYCPPSYGLDIYVSSRYSVYHPW